MLMFLPISLLAQMTMVGEATQFGSCNCYQLTSNGTAQRGAIWSPQPIDLNNDFDMIFDIYVGANDVWGADGMGFVLQENATGIGDIGAGMGFADPQGFPAISANSFAVEIDVYDNGGSVPTDDANDHIGINSNGSKDHNLLAPVTFPGNQEVSDGGYHEFRVQWDATNSILAIYWEGNALPMVVFNYDIINNIFAGNSSVYWGWTASTGGITNESRVCATGTVGVAADLTTLCPGTTVNFTGSGTSSTGMIESWSWDFGDGGPIDNTQNPSYTFNTSGTFWSVLTMTDGFGCERKDSVQITVLPDIDLTMDSTAITCYGDSNGVATATPNNGTGPYTYLWDDPTTQSTQSATNLPAGVHAVTVTDDLGCTGSDSVTIIEPEQILLDMDSVMVDCYKDNTGEATVNITNGVAPFTYSWDDNSNQNTQTATGLTAGTYTVVVTDDNGCSQTDSVTITEPSDIAPTATTTADNGTGTGSIDLFVSGGTPGYTYSWDNGESTEDINNLAAGNYTVTITDANGCSKDTTIVVPSSVGFGDVNEIGFKVYPNPSEGLFTIEGTGEYQVVILDARGRKIYDSVVSETQNIDLRDIEKGFYLLNVIRDGIVYQEKLILK